MARRHKEQWQEATIRLSLLLQSVLAISQCLLAHNIQIGLKSATRCSAHVIIATVGTNDTNLCDVAMQAMNNGKKAQ